MRNPGLRLFAVGVFVFAVSLSGCATSSVSPGGPGFGSDRLTQISPNGQLYGNDGQVVYTGQLYGNDLSVYKEQQQGHGVILKFVETLSNGVSAPEGMKTTINGWWYVANGGDSNILIYRSTHKGPKGPEGTLDDPGQTPNNVDLTTSRQLVVVSNQGTTSTAGSVSVYLRRQAEPSRILTYGKDVVAGIGIALDKHRNCYWSFNDPVTQSGSIVEFAGCDGKGKVVVSGIAKAGGLAFDQHDDLYYVDQASGIYKCKHDSSCKPFATGFGDPVNVNFDLKQKHLWVADATGYIDAVDPNTGKIIYKVKAEGGSSNPPFGIAPEPGG
jgi:DNA-binding beta-propeller fold protein YncE